MKTGDYVRTKDGFIAKLIKKDDWYKFDGVILEEEYTYNYLSKEHAEELIIKSSPNIIDLIEEGDFIGRDIVEEVKEFDDGTRVIVMADGFDEYQENEDFLEAGIVTKEQFASMEYRIGEEK